MRFLFVGDVMLGRLVNERLQSELPEYPWGDTLPLIRKTDARICNLECVLSDGGSPARKAFAFRSDARNVAVLEAAGIDAVALANNHSLDYGTEALADMLGLLDRAGIFHAGAGGDTTEAQALARMDFGDVSVGLLAATDTDEPGWDAQEGKPGVWFVPIDLSDPRARDLLARVRAARAEADVLIISLHWGSNWGSLPEAGHREFAYALIEAGADIVFGHSCHITRGVELYRGKVIMYGAGDFIDDYAVDELERNDESFMFIVDAERDRIDRVAMYPTVIKDFQACLAGPARAKRIAERMETLCKELGTSTEWLETEGALEIEADDTRYSR
ncbi:CapA family protein [Candidatus Kaiserbacteria bacterium]|nr:CapA family protein [Candidatus Kaiserbacteria bacterium]